MTNSYLLYSEGNMFWFYILDKFKQIPGFVQETNNDINLNSISSAADCASYCYTNTNFTCLSFDYCPSSQICSLSKFGRDDGKQMTKNTQCSHYISKFLFHFIFLFGLIR
jgi:hypothetical protein